MAMRPRTSGGATNNSTGNRQSAPAVRPVYEDFKPTSEWIQDQESDILLIYLPGFTKENLKVSTEGRNIIRVRGERLVTGNKWQRFQEDYQVPDYCNLRGTRARFEGGILTVTVPKKTTTPKEESKPTTTQKNPGIPPTKDPVTPKSTALKQEDKAKAFQDSHVPPKPVSPVPPKVPKEPSTQKVQENIPTKITAFQESPVSSNPIPPLPPKSIYHVSDVKRDDQTYSKQEKLPKKSNVEQKHEDDSGASRHQETLSERKAQQGHGEMEKNKIGAELAAKKREVNEGGTRGAESQLIEKKIQETERAEAQKASFVDEDKAKYQKKMANSSGTGQFELGNYKKAVKSIAELDEERKLLVNMGASVLVIMALGAYIYHTVKS